MTLQKHDTLFYEDKLYEIKGVRGKNLYTWQDFVPVIPPEAEIFTPTSCYRGSHADYHLRDNRLILTQISIHVKPWNESITIHGVHVKSDGTSTFLYTNVNLVCRFSGSFILAGLRSYGTNEPLVYMHFDGGELHILRQVPREQMYEVRHRQREQQPVPDELQFLAGHRFHDGLI